MTNTHEEWTEENQKDYDKFLKMFCAKFERDIKQSTDRTGDDPFGFLFLFIREPQADYIDVATNVCDEDAITALKLAIEMIENKSKKG